MSLTMLADAVRSEAYRFSKNRTAVLWSTLFVPVVGLVLSILGNLFLKQRIDEVTDARLPPGMLNGGPLDLGPALVGLAGELANPMLLLFVLIGTATIYAGDYRWETWRLITARNTRPNLILGKVGVAKLLTLAAMVLMVAFGFVGEIAKGLIHERAMTFGFGATEAAHFALLALVAYIRVVQIALIGLLAAVVTRSLLATLFVPLVVTIGQFFLMQAMPLLKWNATDWYAQLAVPGLAYDTLKAAIMGGISAPPAAAAWAAAISLIVWCVALLAAAIALFQRQDLSKE